MRLLVPAVVRSFPAGRQNTINAVVAGSGVRARRLLESNHRSRYEILGYIDDHHEPGIVSEHLGSISDLPKILMITAIDEIVIALPIARCYADINFVIQTCEDAGVDAKYVLDLFEPGFARPSVEFATNSCAALVMKVVENDMRRSVKRAIDIVGACCGVVLFAPLMFATALAIKLDTPGPVLSITAWLSKAPLYGLQISNHGNNRRVSTSRDRALKREVRTHFQNQRRSPGYAHWRVLRKTSIDESHSCSTYYTVKCRSLDPDPCRCATSHDFPSCA
ncbi:MAG: undecaprenyl-phosphate glucose phosphotransferase [Acidobacteriales bacterium]|nr:undecaprenyl-phosphate glucose phosphotransferase [Terriglobales bacterium]